MKKYLLTLATGTITFGYSDAEQLVLYQDEAELSESQRTWVLNRLPKTHDELKALKPQFKGKLEELPEDLTFERFWSKYNKKINKKRCEPMWKKMSDAEKLTCLRSIDPYKAYLTRTNFRGQMDPENYLRKGSYETNWNAES